MNKLQLVILIILINTFRANTQINVDTTSYNSIVQQLNFENENIVVIGEAHDIRNTFNTEFFILKDLAKIGYKTLYIEGGQSEVAILNTYLQTGDTALLKYTRAREPSGSQKQFIQSIYDLNIENKYGFVFKAFDFERPSSVGYLFSKWFGNSKINSIDFKKISDYITSIDEQPSNTLKAVRMKSLKLKIVIDSIKNSFAGNENQYKELLKDNFLIFKNIIFNPCFGDTKDFRNRNYYFNKVLLQEEKKGNLDKVVIITGNAHVLTKNAFIPLLSKDLPEKYSLTCFVLAYSNCRYFTGEKKYNSVQTIKKCMRKVESDNPIINFIITKKRIIPSDRKNISTVIIGMYNQ